MKNQVIGDRSQVVGGKPTPKLDEAVGIARALPAWKNRAVFIVVGKSGAWYARDGKRAFQFMHHEGIPYRMRRYCWDTRKQAQNFIRRLPVLRARIEHATAALGAGIHPRRGRGGR